MEWWHVYLFTRLDVVKEVLISVTIFSFFFAVGFGMFSFGSEGCRFGDKEQRQLRIGFWVSVMFFVGGLLGNLAIPTQKEAAAIYLLPKLVKSEFAAEASKIPTDAAKLLRLKLEEYIAELEPVKEGKK